MYNFRPAADLDMLDVHSGLASFSTEIICYSLYLCKNTCLHLPMESELEYLCFTKGPVHTWSYIPQNVAPESRQ